jgi:hypothetical protein
MLDIERLKQLIEKGSGVLQTRRTVPPCVPTVNSGQFTAWQAQVLNYLQDNLPIDNSYLESFKKNVTQNYDSCVEEGIELLKTIIEDMNLGLLTTEIIPDNSNPINSILIIFDRFHLIVRQLRNRHDSRNTLNVTDEYDVQDLLHSLLMLYFDDIRPEEWTPSYAGKSNRMDFLLKDFKTVIEVKKTRSGLTGKEIGTQLIEDIERYSKHQDCETLLCFVYDPEGLAGNPRGLENDLNREKPIKVQVYVRPN